MKHQDQAFSRQLDAARTRRAARSCSVWIGLVASALFALPAHAMAVPTASAAPVELAHRVVGLKVKKRDVLWGNAHRSTAPGEIVLDTAIDATPEGRQIVDEGIEKGSARYDILMAKAHARVRRVVRTVAIAESRDCVVKTGSYRNPQGLPVVDLTDKVVEELESER